MARVRMLAALACGVMFGFGLALSGMVDPARVRAFLDIGGQWNPSLAFVLGGAVLVATIGYRLALRFGRPAFDQVLQLPTKLGSTGSWWLERRYSGSAGGLPATVQDLQSLRCRWACPRSWCS